jgi:hypothetical chaperone protein
MTEPRDVLTNRWATPFTIQDLVAVILRWLKQVADRQYGCDVTRLVIGSPVAFVASEGTRSGEGQDNARARLRSAALLAGFDDVSFFPEPSASALVFGPTGQVTVALDFGGGTFDVAIIDRRRGDTPILLEGAPIGGDLLDAELFRGKVGPRLGLVSATNGKPLPRSLMNGFATMSGTVRLMADRQAYSDLRTFRLAPGGELLRGAEAMLVGGQAYRVHRAVEKAKIELSEREVTRIHFGNPELPDDISITRGEFEACIATHLRAVESTILEALASAKVDPNDVDTVLQTGGSSRIPAFKQITARMFARAQIVEQEPFTTVTRGLARSAQIEHAAAQGRRKIPTAAELEKATQPVGPTDVPAAHVHTTPVDTGPLLERPVGATGRNSLAVSEVGDARYWRAMIRNDLLRVGASTSGTYSCNRAGAVFVRSGFLRSKTYLPYSPLLREVVRRVVLSSPDGARFRIDPDGVRLKSTKALVWDFARDSPLPFLGSSGAGSG